MRTKARIVPRQTIVHIRRHAGVMSGRIREAVQNVHDRTSRHDGPIVLPIRPASFDGDHALRADFARGNSLATGLPRRKGRMSAFAAAPLRRDSFPAQRARSRRDLACRAEAPVDVRLRGCAATARQTSREETRLALACRDEARRRRAKSGGGGSRTRVREYAVVGLYMRSRS
jgi:hypothetical protein